MVDPWNVCPEDVVVTDIARALSRLCRYTGHSRHFYSVAQHSVLVSRLLDFAGESSTICMQGLMHDAAEAYLGDLNSPTKSYLPEFKLAEERAEIAISKALRFPPITSRRVKDADTAAFWLERYYLLPHTHQRVEDETLEAASNLGFSGVAVDAVQDFVGERAEPDKAYALFLNELSYLEDRTFDTDY